MFRGSTRCPLTSHQRTLLAERNFSMSRASNGSKIVGSTVLSPGEAKFTKLRKINWKDPGGKERVWECADRSTRGLGGIDAVGIIAILKNAKEGPSIVLGKQFRPPTEGLCVEFPAGLIDEGESPEQTAVRELKEETGYVGTATSATDVMYCDPGLSSANMKAITIEIDMNCDANQNPITQLEDGEHIETFITPLKDLHKELHALAQQGHTIDARLVHFAMGLDISKKLNL